MMIKKIAFVLSLHYCCCKVYRLNDAEYERMPALSALDPYERCLRRGGPYCVLRLHLSAQPGNELMDLIRDYSEHKTKHYDHRYIERGVCVPETCKQFYDWSDQNLSVILGACMNDSITRQYGIEAKLSHIYYCDEEAGQRVDFVDWLVAVLCGALVTTSIAGSIYDYVSSKRRAEKNHWTGNQYLLSFSVFRNWESLLKPMSEETEESAFKIFDGIRCVGTFFVIFAHVMLTTGSGFTANPHDFEKGYETAFYQVIFNAMVMVQIFFFMTGFLMVYHLQKYAEKKNISWAMVPKIVFIRWCRLSPAYAVMLAFTATWLRHLGSGPVWNLYVGGAAADCRSYWWLHLLYLQNYVPDDKFCAMHTWHLATDLQLFAVGLIAYMVSLARGRILAIIPFVVLGMLSPALHVLFQDLDPMVLMTPETYRTVYNDTFTWMHIRGHNNLPCFFIGMLVGYFVHSWQKKGQPSLNKKMIGPATWCVIPALILWLLTGRIFYADDVQATLGTRMLYAAFHHAVVGSLIAFGILAMILKSEDKLRCVFEWRGWVVPSRLSYSVYLLHMCVVHILLGAKMQTVYVSTFTLIINQLGVVVLSYILAVPFYVLVESPVSKILKIILDKDRIQRTEKIPLKTE